MIINCKICSKEFKTYPSRIKIGKGKYCSKECGFLALKGRPSPFKGIKLTIEQKAKMNLSGLELGRGWNKGKKLDVPWLIKFKKGHIPWNKGIEGFGKWPKWNPKDKDNPAWKGDDVKYGALHDWIRGKLGSPLVCSICDKENENSKMFHWHNTSGEYKRDLDDWLRVCAKCHKQIHKYAQA